jgi:hypothetical protein
MPIGHDPGGLLIGMQIIGGYSAGIDAGLTCHLGRAGAIADQAAGRGKKSIPEGRRYRSAGRERYEAIFAIVEHRVG